MTQSAVAAVGGCVSTFREDAPAAKRTHYSLSKRRRCAASFLQRGRWCVAWKCRCSQRKKIKNRKKTRGSRASSWVLIALSLLKRQSSDSKGLGLLVSTLRIAEPCDSRGEGLNSPACRLQGCCRCRCRSPGRTILCRAKTKRPDMHDMQTRPPSVFRADGALG